MKEIKNTFGNYTFDSWIPKELQEQRKCFHYTNLQPLWMSENRQKNRRSLI